MEAPKAGHRSGPGLACLQLGKAARRLSPACLQEAMRAQLSKIRAKNHTSRGALPMLFGMQF